jgi:hypothetical protein
MDPVVAEARLKSMVAWSTDPTLSQGDITTLLTASQRADSTGKSPGDAGYVPTYALDWAAREAWTWKAGSCADRYRVVGDGTELERNQVFQHCERMFTLYDKRYLSTAGAGGGFQNVRSRGATLEDRLGQWSAIPWWWELSGN